jgi:dipeptidyl aminopeptidase/acylaminoacyl peptidase
MRPNNPGAFRFPSGFRARFTRVAFLCLIGLVLLIPAAFAQDQEAYQKPAKEILDVLNAPLPPSLILSPKRDMAVLAQPVVYPDISDLAAPMLRLAGVRFNPNNNAARYYISYFTSLTLKRLADGVETPVSLPPEVKRIGRPGWNADGTMFVFTNELPNKIELWIVEAATGKARLLPGLRLNPILMSEVQWMPDQKTLLVKLTPDDRGPVPEPPVVPPGPKIRESSGASASSTYEVRDVLKSPYDEGLFDYYARSQLALVSVASGEVTRIGQPALYFGVSPAPGGRYIYVERIHRPYSYLHPFYRFPQEVDIWTTAGEPVEHLASLPLFDQVPIEGVQTGPRFLDWRPTEPATIVWVEALDGGNPKAKVPHRDKIVLKAVGAPAVELTKLEERLNNLQWVEKGSLALVSDYDPDKHWTRTWVIDAARPTQAPRLLWDMSYDEKYKNPGYPVYRIQPNGTYALLQQDGHIFLDGAGYSPEGDRPFLDRLDLRTFKTERLFRCDRESYEYFVTWINPAAGTFITRRETPADFPNYYLRTLGKGLQGAPEGEAVRTSTAKAVTTFPNPYPQLAGIQKRLVTYKRADGLPLSFTLYLPPGYKEGTRLPTVLWAYPLDYAEQSTAGQIEGSTKMFTRIMGSSELFFLLAGYVVLEDTAMPVVGPPETAYDTFIEQITANAKAAIDKAVELGVTDPDRVGVGGHSHGALMTANLLTWTDLFRTGVARSGAYNHTLRPFGFQNEHRTFYQARDTYIHLSPTLNADRLKVPIMLIHGELDANPGTVPLQSEKYYEALRGLGKTVRYIVLPYESHGYQARQSIEHVLYEEIAWFDKYVKNAPPRAAKQGAAESPEGAKK